MSNKKALQFGAGNIGRGLNAYLLQKNNFHFTFIDISKDIIKKLDHLKAYKIVELNDEKKQEIRISNFEALCILEQNDLIIEKIADVDLITISIGFSNLIKIRNLLVKGLKKRILNKNKKYLNIIAIENGVNASKLLKKYVFDSFSKEEIKKITKTISFVDCAVDRIVPNQPEQYQKNLNVNVEKNYELILDSKNWLGNKIDFVLYEDDLEKFIERKLFMLNGTHALIAWNEIKNKTEFIYEFKENSQLFSIVKNYLKNLELILLKKYDFNHEDLKEYSKKIIKRLSNEQIKDKATRVGRGVIRKVSKEERFGKPLIYAFNNNLNIDPFIKAIAIPFSKLNFDDEEQIILNNDLKKENLENVIRKYTKLEETYLIEKIKNEVIKIS